MLSASSWNPGYHRKRYQRTLSAVAASLVAYGDAKRTERETMLLTNHVLSGALIGAMVRRPVPAFVLGVASHFALDAVPHWGDWQGDPGRFLQVAVQDGLTALALMAALAAAAPPARRPAVTAGMFGAALPDADKPTRLWFGFSPFPAAVGRFHGRIQDEAPGRFPFEAATAGVFAVAAAGALYAARRQRPASS